MNMEEKEEKKQKKKRSWSYQLPLGVNVHRDIHKFLIKKRNSSF